EPDVYDPATNPLYRDVLAHYGVTALPCRVRHPDRKGKVESAVGHAQHKLQGLRFERLEEGQAYLDRWEERWADTRIHGPPVRQERGRRRMRDEDCPKRTPPTTLQLLARAARAGEHVGAVCQAIHRQDGEVGVRRILGVLSCVKKHGPAAADEACAAALDLQ